MKVEFIGKNASTPNTRGIEINTEIKTGTIARFIKLDIDIYIRWWANISLAMKAMTDRNIIMKTVIYGFGYTYKINIERGKFNRVMLETII